MRVQIVLQRVALDKIQQYFRNWIWCILSLQWRHNECDGFANHRHLHCLLNRLFRHRSKKISKLHVTGLCGEFTGHPAQMASYAEDVSIWWRHHANCVMYNEHCQEDNGYALQSDSNWMANQTKCSHEVLISKLRNKFHRDWLSITCVRKRWRATAWCGKSKFAISSGWLKTGSVSHPDDIITLP